MEKEEGKLERGRKIEKAECHVYKASILRDIGTRPVIPFVFNELSLSLDYRTRGFDVVMGSNESIDNVDELMMLVIHRQSSSTPRCRLLRSSLFVIAFLFHLLFNPFPV